MYLVRADPSETLEYLEGYREELKYQWPVTVPDQHMLSKFRILSQSSKVGVDGNGIITYRDGYGRGRDSWEGVFAELASQ
jgi:hypothetical protein